MLGIKKHDIALKNDLFLYTFTIKTINQYK